MQAWESGNLVLAASGGKVGVSGGKIDVSGGKLTSGRTAFNFDETVALFPGPFGARGAVGLLAVCPLLLKGGAADLLLLVGGAIGLLLRGAAGPLLFVG